VGLLPGRESLGPLALMLITPIFIFVLWYTMYHLHGDFGEMVEGFKQVRARVAGYIWVLVESMPRINSLRPTSSPNHLESLSLLWQDGFSYLGEIIPTPFDPTAWKVILSYMAVELAFMRCVYWLLVVFVWPTAAGGVGQYRPDGWMDGCDRPRHPSRLDRPTTHTRSTGLITCRPSITKFNRPSRFLPGKTFKATITPAGNVPVYKVRSIHMTRRPYSFPSKCRARTRLIIKYN
jgi:hypothetical protein